MYINIYIFMYYKYEPESWSLEPVLCPCTRLSGPAAHYRVPKQTKIGFYEIPFVLNFAKLSGLCQRNMCALLFFKGIVKLHTSQTI